MSSWWSPLHPGAPSHRILQVFLGSSHSRRPSKSILLAVKTGKVGGIVKRHLPNSSKFPIRNGWFFEFGSQLGSMWTQFFSKSMSPTNVLANMSLSARKGRPTNKDLTTNAWIEASLGYRCFQTFGTRKVRLHIFVKTRLTLAWKRSSVKHPNTCTACEVCFGQNSSRRKKQSPFIHQFLHPRCFIHAQY